jgi:asparagine synthase (glutamine-hydrolysing)
MAGIVGLLRTGSRPLPPTAIVSQMLGAVAHRGKRGVADAFISSDIYIGVAGRQIGHDVDRRTITAHDGYVTNVVALKQALQQKSHHAFGDDTGDLLAKVFDCFGSSAVDRLDGAFALVVWQPQAGALLLARDRPGLRPLYYAVVPGYLVFGSEIKAILASQLIAPEIDLKSVDDVFSLWFPLAPRTMFQGISELRPAHVLKASGRGVEAPSRYWRVPFRRRGDYARLGEQEAQEGMRTVLRRSIRSCVETDDAVALYLSGGLDSAVIVALFADEFACRPTTLTLTARTLDESHEASIMARRVGANSLTQTLGANLVQKYAQAVRQAEIPLVSPLMLSNWAGSDRLQKEGFSVVLTGDGADELLAGHHCHRAAILARLLDRAGLRTLYPVAHWLLGAFDRTAGSLEFAVNLTQTPYDKVRRIFGGVYPAWYKTWHFLDLERTSLLSPDGRAVRSLLEPPDGITAFLPEHAAEMHPLDAALLFEFETKMPSWNLLVADRAARASGMEARQPFLTVEAIEFLAALPPSVRIRRFKEKWLMRQGMAGIIPDSIRNRSKSASYHMMSSPFFGESPSAMVDEVMSGSAIRSAGLFSGSAVQKLRRAALELPAGNFHRVRAEAVLTMVLGVQLLHRTFVNATSYDTGPSIEIQSAATTDGNRR